MRCRKIQTRLTRSCTLHARKLNPEPNWKRNSIAVLAACSLGGCMTQRGIPAAGTVLESRVVTTGEYPITVSYPAGLQQDYMVCLSLDRFGIENFYLTVRFRSTEAIW